MIKSKSNDTTTWGSENVLKHYLMTLNRHEKSSPSINTTETVVQKKYCLMVNILKIVLSN